MRYSFYTGRCESSGHEPHRRRLDNAFDVADLIRVVIIISDVTEIMSLMCTVCVKHKGDYVQK